MSCGQCLEVSRANRSVVIVVADYCPECSPKQLDINDMASSKLSTRNRPENYVDLQVKKVVCNWHAKRQYYLDKGSSVYNWYIIPLFLERPLKSLSVLNQSAIHDKYGRWVIGFRDKFPNFGNVEVKACDSKSCFSDYIKFSSFKDEQLKDEL